MTHTMPAPAGGQQQRQLADLPPPAAWMLMDADRHVGWIATDAIRFRGFADETEASHAAWVAYRALTRRHPELMGQPPVPVDAEPVALARAGDAWAVQAMGRTIGTLVLPDGDDTTVGFEIRVPRPSDEHTMHAAARFAYGTLRKSGVRWALLAPARSRGRVLPQPRPDPDAVSSGEATSDGPRSAMKAAALLACIFLVTVALALVTQDVRTRIPSGAYVLGVLRVACGGAAIATYVMDRT